MKNMSPILTDRLLQHQTKGWGRSLRLREGCDLSSNDYLGFSCDSVLKQNVIEAVNTVSQVGSTGSRLLRGHSELYDEVESMLAQFVGCEQALLFPSAYQANLAVISALLRPGDIVFSDELNHASLIDGIRLSRAEKVIYPHRDLQRLKDELSAVKQKNSLKIIVTESLFSMDGTLADLNAIHELAEEFNAYMVVDEAHSTGLWGGSYVNSQLPRRERIIATVHAGGKALGISGGWVAGPSILKDTMINFARPFIYSTAPSPLLAVLMREAVWYYKQVGEMRANEVLTRADYFKKGMKNYVKPEVIGPIVPIIVGNVEHAMDAAMFLQKRGWDVRPIRPPTVPEGQARLRVTVKWENSVEQLKQFSADVIDALKIVLV
jgi:8-amino-7-oxononanoate synthase